MNADGYDPVQAARARLGADLKRLRLDAKVTQDELARAIKAGGSTVSDLERGVGRRTPAADAVAAFIDHCLRLVDAAPALLAERRRELLRQYESLASVIEYDRENRRNRPAAGVPVTHTLPRDVRAFYGRDAQLRLLSEAAGGRAGDSVPIFVVEGMPGVGKTALAVHAAHLMREGFPDGSLFLPLHAHTPGRSPVDVGEALTTLLTGVGLSATAIPAGLPARTALWRHQTARRRLLVVFDDVEALDQVESLLPGSPASLVILTSRHRLGVPGAVPIELAELPADHARDLLDNAAGTGRHPAADLAAVIERSGSLPLTIGIVGGWLREHSGVPVTELLARMDDVELRPHTMRHGGRTVAAAFDVSYAGMPVGRRAFFRALGANPGTDVDRFAGAALAGVPADQSRALLQDLFAQHLLEEPALGRYRMHDLVAQYAADLAAASPETAAARERVATYYRAAAAHASGLLAHPARRPAPSTEIEVREIADRQAAVGWFRAERHNVSAIVEERARTGAPAAAVALAAAYAEYDLQYGPGDQAVALHRVAADSAMRSGDLPGAAGALLTLGLIQRLADDNEASVRSLTVALSHFTALADEPGVVRARTALGASLWRIGDYERAGQELTLAVTDARHLGGAPALAAALAELGTLHLMSDRYPEAATALEESVALHEDLDDQLGAANALRMLGTTYYISDRYDQARTAASRALAIFSDLAHPIGEAQSLMILGAVLRLSGDYGPAEEALVRAGDMFRELQKTSSEAQAMTELGALLGSTGRADEGARILRAAVERSESINDLLCAPAALNQLGEVLRVLGEIAEAERVLLDAQARYEALDDRLGLAAVANVHGAVLLDAGRPEAAKERYVTGLRHAEEIGNPLEEGLAHEGLGRSAQALGQDTEAVAGLLRAHEIFSRIGAAELTRVADRLRSLGGLT